MIAYVNILYSFAMTMCQVSEVRCLFMDFEVKQNMRVAPTLRIEQKRQKEITDTLTLQLHKQVYMNYIFFLCFNNFANVDPF